jgi:predicted DNA-binding transcriptional regulator AlpA
LDLQIFRKEQGDLLKQEKLKDIDYRLSQKRYTKDRVGEQTSERSPILFEKRIWRVEDVASFLGCATGHVYNLSSDEKIPKRKKRGLLYFVPDEILSWVLEGDAK